MVRVVLLCLGSGLFVRADISAGNWGGNYQPCNRHAEVLKAGHMNLGVRFTTSDSRLAVEFTRALNFWTTILDMEWYVETGDDCSLALVDGDRGLFKPAEAARAQFPDAPTFQGWIAFNRENTLSGDEEYLIAVHELGHLFGLPHNDSPSSVMYFLCLEGRAFLDASDLANLAAHHRLRVTRQDDPLVVNDRVGIDSWR